MHLPRTEVVLPVGSKVEEVIVGIKFNEPASTPVGIITWIRLLFSEGSEFLPNSLNEPLKTYRLTFILLRFGLNSV